MELLQLRYFRVVARREHMTKAAEELSIAQPSLSKTIRRLEQEIGVPLFDRQGRSLQLNQFGKAQLGVGFTTALMEKRTREHTLTPLHLTNPTCQRSFGIAWHQKHYLSQAAQAFSQFVREYSAPFR